MTPFPVEILLPPVEGKSGRKFKLRIPPGREWKVETGIRPWVAVNLPYLALSRNGVLTLKELYAIDGSSGAADTLNSIEAAFGHDGLTQLIRGGYLPLSARKPADRLYRDTCIGRTMWPPRAKNRYRFLRAFGRRSVRKGKEK